MLLSVVVKFFQPLRRELLLNLFPQFSVSNLYFIMLAITFSYVKYTDYSKNVFSLIVLLLFWLLRECYLMIPISIIGSIRVYILLCKYYFHFFQYIYTMALNDAEIENLLRGDMSDIEDFNDDEDDLNEEQIITQHIAEITEYIDLNNAEMYCNSM
jgi:hypothetical protein